jgi:hypothetical protein
MSVLPTFWQRILLLVLLGVVSLVSTFTLDSRTMIFGLNTNLFPTQITTHDLTLSAFKQDITTMADKHLSMVRFTLLSEEVVKSVQGQTITWNNDKLAVYDQAIHYAHRKGLKIFLVVNAPVQAKAYPLLTYRRIAADYFSFLAKRYRSDVSIMQLFNEPNIHSFRDYTPIKPDDVYLSQLNDVTTDAIVAVKEVSPHMQVTLNVGGWPLSNAQIQQWKTFYDALRPSKLDFLSLDLYPDDDLQLINSLPQIVAQFKTRYQKDIFVSEIGMPSFSGRFSEQDQAKYLSLMVTALAKANVLGILPYAIRDEARNTNKGEASMGLLTADGTPKQAFDAVLTAMKLSI